MKTTARIAVIMGALFVLIAAACGDDQGAGIGAPANGDDGGTPVAAGSTRALAPIERVEIDVAGSSPSQYVAHIVSGLPNGCVQFDRYDIVRDGDTIRVEVWNLVPSDPATMCTMVYGTVDLNVALGSDFVSGRTYTVEVNGETHTFTAR